MPSSHPLFARFGILSVSRPCVSARNTRCVYCYARIPQLSDEGMGVCGYSNAHTFDNSRLANYVEYLAILLFSHTTHYLCDNSIFGLFYLS